MSKSAALKAASQIDGWLTPGEEEALYDFGLKAQGPIVEIGSCFGRSTSLLALGSMAGNHQPVYAIDSFVGVHEQDRKSCNGNQPGPACSSAALLRANLDAAGINGLVKIVAKPSVEAAPEIPDGIDVLFIDGAHDFASVHADIAHYAPKVRVGGKIVMHDATSLDPGVLQALDATLTPDSARWQPIRRIDSAVVYERRQETERLKVFLAVPGGNLMYAAVAGLLTASRGLHDVAPKNSSNGFDDMATLWVDALNMAHRGEITHFAMLHSDINPSQGWIDILASEMARLGADLVSTVVALKDQRGLTSTGIGDAANPWGAWRRFTMREVHETLPETFSIADTPHPDKYLLHNTGCWLADLRNPKWRTVDANGWLAATLSFPIAAKMQADGTIVHMRESEDWYFSRKIAELGLKTYASRTVSATHFGNTPYANNRPWGDYLFGDADTAPNWRKT